MTTTQSKDDYPVIVREVDDKGNFEIKFETPVGQGTETYVTISNRDELDSIKALADAYAGVMATPSGRENGYGQNVRVGLPLALYKLRDAGNALDQFMGGNPSSDMLNDAVAKCARIPAREFAIQVEAEVAGRIRAIQESLERAENPLGVIAGR